MKKHLYKALSGSQYNFHKALAELGLEQFTVEVVDPTDWKPKTRVRTVSENFLKRKANLKRAGKEFGSRIAPKAVIQYTKDNVFIAEFHSISEAVKQTGICAKL